MTLHVALLVGALTILCLTPPAPTAEPAAKQPWPKVTPSDSNQVRMGGAWGGAYDHGLQRIAKPPYTPSLIMADVDFNMARWFTNFSGDVSGRFLELASRTSAPDHPEPHALSEVMARFPKNQMPDGHFGADVDWAAPIDFEKPFNMAKMMPIMWGNGRLLSGLTAAYERFGDNEMLACAKRLGDFYVNTAVDRFCDPRRKAEYAKSPGYAAAYVTCVYEGMEGLVRLYQDTNDPRYLKTAERMADFHQAYDVLPVEHAHGSLGQHVALLLLYEQTGQTKYLDRVTRRWEQCVSGGYVNPTGGVLEKLMVSFDRDEGCAEADWLRLNLELWHATGDTRYLDMAEREMWGEYLANQWPSGGYGHRKMHCDVTGAYAFGAHDQEALWCCVFHGPLGLYYLKSTLAAASSRGLFYNFPVPFTAPVKFGAAEWTITSQALPEQPGIPVATSVTLAGPAGAHAPLCVRVPEWASQVVITQDGKPLAVMPSPGYLKTLPLPAGATLQIAYYGQMYLEDRRFKRAPAPMLLPATLNNVVVRYGPKVLMSADHGDVQTIRLAAGPDGLQLQKDDAGQVLPWDQMKNPEDAHAFVFNVTLDPG